MLGGDHQPESGRQMVDWLPAPAGCIATAGSAGLPALGLALRAPQNTPTGRPVSPTQTPAKRISRGRALNDGEGDKGTEIWIGDRVLV